MSGGVQEFRSNPHKRYLKWVINVANGDPARQAQAVGTLSGGNQQKVVLARWLATEPRLFLLDEPTRGVDVPTKAEILDLAGELARAGKSVLLISSEIDEIMRVSHRYVVLRRGEIVQELPRTATREELMTAATGASQSTLGLLNGLIVVVLRVNPLIATLGTMIALRGIGLDLTNASVVPLPEVLRRLGNLTIGPSEDASPPLTTCANLDFGVRV